MMTCCMDEVWNGVHEVQCVCIVHILGHEATKSSFVMLCVW